MRRTLCESALSGVREDVDIDKALAEMSDGGAGADRLYRDAERAFSGMSEDETRYARCIAAAKVRVWRRAPELLRVLLLVLRHRQYRGESIAVLAREKGISRKAANNLYWLHLKKLENIFLGQ